jgi:hypothetical protein
MLFAMLPPLARRAPSARRHAMSFRAAAACMPGFRRRCRHSAASAIFDYAPLSPLPPLTSFFDICPPLMPFRSFFSRHAFRHDFHFHYYHFRQARHAAAII